jgi:hypothetical protein
MSDPTGVRNKECTGLAEYIGVITYGKKLVDQSTVVVNILLKILCVWLVKQLNFANKSSETKRIMILVFLIQFFNTGPLQLLVHADHSQLGISFLNFFNAGYHPDFTVRWYKDVGYLIINAMIGNIAAPLMEVGIAITLKFVFRVLDRRSLKSGNRKTTTKRHSIESYIDLYAGPQYFLHSKYSNLLNITFMTLMFGVGLPILFPIALVSFLVIYLLERVLVAYYYRQPELTDNSLAATALYILQCAPLLYLAVGTWMMSNIQIFYNDVILTQRYSDHYETGHSLARTLWPPKLTYYTPLFLAFIFELLIVLTYPLWTQPVRKALGVGDLADDKTEQAYFYETLTNLQRECITREEYACREILGVTRISDRTLQRLNDSYTTVIGKGRETELIGIPTYDILDNPHFQDKFQYLPEAFESRSTFVPLDEDLATM